MNLLGARSCEEHEVLHTGHANFTDSADVIHELFINEYKY